MQPSRNLFLVSLLLASSTMWAQPAKTADDDLKSLRVLAAPRPTGASGRSDAQAETERRQQVAAYVAAAQQAKTFRDKNPFHSGAAESKKIEAECMLRAVQIGGVEHETNALRLARDYRADKSNSSRDRFDVAVLARDIGVRKENHGMSREDQLAAYEKVAKDLYGEFPDEPAAYEMFLGIARTAEPVKARAIANQLFSMPAPAGIKDQARTILARLDLPGKALAAQWTDDKGDFHQVADYKGKTLVFYVWASWAPSAEAAQALKTQVGPAAVLVSVNVDQDVAAGRAAKTKNGIDGIAYFDSRSLNGPLPTQLQVNRVPGFYVVDKKGVFVGGGGPEQLAALLDAAK